MDREIRAPQGPGRHTNRIVVGGFQPLFSLRQSELDVIAGCHADCAI
jgi:hypothetical protein